MTVKKEIREKVLASLKEYSLLEKREQDILLTERFLRCKSYREAQTIATYLSLPHELDTSLLIKRALIHKKRVVTPKVYPDGQMVFVDYDKDNLVRSSFGVWEVASDGVVSKDTIDVIHVPGLAFNEQGYRIGYGGGYYDRYLEDFTGQTISTLYPFQLLLFEPEMHDIAVDQLILFQE